jgi:hypothetical protein
MDRIHLLRQALGLPQPIDGIGNGRIGGQALVHQFTGRVFDVNSDLCEYFILVRGCQVKMICDI